ncbi:MAG: ABC transporter ATP-binding protein [Candidatus Omnitrophica bacterium]|nr:ABC transporter ATP-binding protein [Candidatus Omnitrophota bacterium]MDD5080825.1 ABC transporter ATP-binding protein [Candidatus Omnitrophota bacterium]
MSKYFKEYFKLLKFTKSHLGLLGLASACMLVSTLFEGVSLGMIVPLADRILTNKKIVVPGGVPKFLQDLVDWLNNTDSMLVLKYIAVFMICVFFLKGIFIYLQGYFMNVMGQSVVRDVRNKLYAKFQSLSLSFYSKQRTGELMARVTNDVLTLTNALSYALTDLIYEGMRLCFLGTIAIYLALKISWKMSFFAFIIFPAIMIPVVRIGKRIKNFSKLMQEKMADLNTLLSETIQGMQIVKAFCREDYELERFKKINYNYYKFSVKMSKRILVLSPLTEFVGVCGAVTVLWLVGREVITGSLSFGVFGLFLGSLLSMMRPIKKISNVHAINLQALVSSERIYSVLDRDEIIREIDNPKVFNGVSNGIEFNEVWFKYVPSDDYVLKAVSFKVPKGNITALVGHSGAGKTTIVGLLPRFYDLAKGSIRIDGTDIKDFSLKSLRSSIAIVSQDMVLFNSTIRQNIEYGKSGATDEEIISAAKKANAYDFIMSLPKKFDSVIGDKGFCLSGGEKQRLSIARAILKDAPILILDEATSQLDSQSEQLVQDALYSLMKNKTVFVIAHRLSTVQKADEILVIDSGSIIEKGRHDELIAKNGMYKKLYDIQFKS